MNPLARKLARLCTANGPMSLAEYFHACMADNEYGYYKTRETIGAPGPSGGDFITSPEISQMFGELLGVWCVDTWHKLGRPKKICLAEFGPGRGRMMHDLLRAAALDPDFLDAIRLHLVETSGKLREEQAKTLKDINVPITWISEPHELPNMPLLAIGNEFLDALPFRQYVKQDAIWREIGVNVTAGGKAERVSLTANIDGTVLPPGADEEPEGSVFEYAPAREAFASMLANQLAEYGGAILMIDYGHLRSGFGDTFQAVKDHRKADPFDTPGQCDLTSHVDFERIARAMVMACKSPVRMATQGQFLLGLGLLERAGALGAPHTDEVRARIRAEAERLAGPDGMGELFKVICMTSPDINAAGFQEVS